MGQYVKVDATTGELHERDCGICGFTSFSGEVSEEEIAAFEEANAAPGHILVELKSHEHDLFMQVRKSIMRGGKRIEVPYDENVKDDQERRTEEIHCACKVDVSKVTRKIKDRVKVDKPVKINLMGGEEIIGYVPEPEDIVVKRKIARIEKKLAGQI